ncbi:hypothetical protein [Amycolatopsis sp. CA-126428]|uniref:hypothetical protein n=1 Tax=Amycolatopsis sp. CA-126428 TaxID=2073158 RepID=UPI000CD089A8|nr:hypothetical protein [Amycolatopsis sp. CA-126428]
MTAGIPIGASELTLDAREVVMVSEALHVLTSEHAAQPLRRLWFGADERREPELRTRLSKWIIAERAYETSHSARPPELALPLSDAHLVHCSLVLSTELISSEEEYKERAGSFREEAIALAGAVTDAVLRLPPLTARLPAADPEPAAPAQVKVAEARLVHASLVHVLGRAGTPAVAWLWLGVDAPEGHRFAGTFEEAIVSAEESGARRVPLEVADVHLAYCALVLATRLIRSEAAYQRETGRFKEDARRAGVAIMRDLRTRAAGD